MALYGKRKITVVILAGTLLLAALGFSYFLLMPGQKDDYPLDLARLIDPSKTDHTKRSVKQAPEASPGIINNGAVPNNAYETDLSVEDRLVSLLGQQYDGAVFQKSTLLVLLNVKRFLTGLYPEDGFKRFYNVLERAYPDMAGEIMEALDKLEQYLLWLQENRRGMAGMNDLEKQGFLWQKREELFGDRAGEIWSEEVLAYEQRKEEMHDTIFMLEDADDITIEEKLDIYKNALYRTYADSPEAYVLENKATLANAFVTIESVQEALKQMPPDHRQWEINKIRRELGISETHIKQMAELDAHRNRRWEHGLEYMKERNDIALQYDGREREEQLDALRKKYFNHAAITIEREENDGFFRFERERIFGRN